MKLNKIASAIAIIGFGLCSAAWSADPSFIEPSANASFTPAVVGVTGVTAVTGVTGNLATLATGTVLDMGSVINGAAPLTVQTTLATPATTIQGDIAIISGTTTNYVAPVTAVNGVTAVTAVPLTFTSTSVLADGTKTSDTQVRYDAATLNADGTYSQKVNTITSTKVDLGTNTSPKQGTLGGPGGVSGLGYSQSTVTVTNGAETTMATGSKIVVGTVYAAGSVMGGNLYSSGGTVTKEITAKFGDKVFAQLISGTATVTASVSAGSGIKGTDHDFATKVVNGNTASVGLCTYCHTPHKASSTLLLWNKTMSTNTFKWDVAATTAGTALPGFSGSSYSGPSAKCLACHDGSVAIGDIGWFAGGGKTGTAAINPKTMYDVSDRFVMGGSNGQLGAGATYAKALSTAAAFGGSAVHPVAIPYPLNGAPNVYNGSVTGARLATADFVADPTANNIRLYTDVGGGSITGKVTAGKTGMECSSCHDVHNKAATDKYFLRGKLVGATLADGYICAQCHQK